MLLFGLWDHLDGASKDKKSTTPTYIPQSYSTTNETIMTREKYMKALERLYVQFHGKLGDWQIEKFIKGNRLDITNKMTVSDVKADLRDIEKKLKGQPSVPKPTYTSQSYSNTKETIMSREKYMKALESLYVQNGNKLTDRQIEKFIKDNRFDVTNGATISGVKFDLKDIDKKLNPQMRTKKSIFATHKKYVEALESLYIQNGNKLTDRQIEKFINESMLDVANGLTISDVKADLRDIEKKLNDKKTTRILCYEDYVCALNDFWHQNGDKSLLDDQIKNFILTYGMDIKNPNMIADIRMDLVFIQSKLPLNSETAKSFKQKSVKTDEPIHTVDDTFTLQVAEIILKHKEKFSEKSSIKGLLWDYFPEKKKENNVLMILVNYGILEDIQSKKNIDSVFISKYVTRLVEENGIDENFAKEMTLIWCYGYGESLLGKKVII